jgi:IclR family acetate operon transcriptional repressor
LLSELDDTDLYSLLQNVHLQRFAANTILDKDVFLKELKKIRKQGYATSISELVRGGASVCVPVRHYVCPVALSVLGPDNRLTRDAMMKLLPEIKAGADRISKKLLNGTSRISKKWK